MTAGVSRQAVTIQGEIELRVSEPSEVRAFDVGGVLLDRPFKVRRLGHFGYNCVDTAAMLAFYRDTLGLCLSDVSRPLDAQPEKRERLGDADAHLYFLRYGTEHHQFVLTSQRLWDLLAESADGVGRSVNQVTWQVGSLAEVVNGAEWFGGTGQRLFRSGRDMPGSNWHTYLFDPDGTINELYYGMEQIGWDGLSKPRQLHAGRFLAAPSLPQPSEEMEVLAALDQGMDPFSGHGREPDTGPTVEVDGILMRRPFKVVRLGPVSLFTADVEAATRFYRDTLGFRIRQEVTWREQRCVFLSANTDHHLVALYPLALRSALGLAPRLDSMALGFQVANYRQLREAVAYLEISGARRVDIPAELTPGFDFVTHLQDPDGNLVQLYYYLAQSGFAAGQPSPIPMQAPPRDWPQTVRAPDDVYGGEAFLGPWA